MRKLNGIEREMRSRGFVFREEMGGRLVVVIRSRSQLVEFAVVYGSVEFSADEIAHIEHEFNRGQVACVPVEETWRICWENG